LDVYGCRFAGDVESNGEPRMTHATLLVIVALLQAGDWYTTRTIIAKGGRELNPAIRWLMGKLGVDLALAVKTAAMMAIASHSVVACIPLVVIYSYACWHNAKALRAMP